MAHCGISGRASWEKVHGTVFLADHWGDVSYAYRRREITPTEQHVHAFLEMLPVMGLLIVVTLHWEQFVSLFGLGQEVADVIIRLREPPLPWLYVSVILFLVVFFEVLPYLEELVRGIRCRKETIRD
jgi:hypothetical protein